MPRIDEQVRATMPDRSVLLSASAGSGKTRVLVRRMIHLLAAGIAPDRIAAITFTEKAAGEMKDRLFEDLSKAAWGKAGITDLLELSPNDMPYPLTKTPEDIFSALTARPDILQVSTVHAFCLKLLRQFPIEAGLPPDFRVMDEAEIPIRREQAVIECLESVRERALEGGLMTLIDAGLSLRDIKDLLVLALDKRGQISRLVTDAGGFDGFMKKLDRDQDLASKIKNAEEIIHNGGLRRAAGELAGLLNENGLGDPDYVASIERVAGISGIEDLPEVFEALKGYVYTKGLEFKAKTPVSKKAAGADLKARHDSLFYALREELNMLASLHDDIMAAGALTDFLRLYRDAEETYTAINRRDGGVDYDDLEIHAYRLLTGPDADNVLRRVEARVLHYLIDEFQDTGRVQWGILDRLNSETFAGMGAEGLMSPTLFAVGDVKQSIYRFRKADYHLMETLKRKMESHIEKGRREFPELVHNFRSAPEIIRVVDETFGALWDGYRPSVVFRESARGSVKLRVTQENAEAEALADEVVSATGLPLWDDKEGRFRPADFGDMAILIRSRAGLKTYEDALKRRGVHYKVTGGVGFFFQEEVQAILGILNYIENPADMLSLVTALKSPLFMLSDGDIEPIFKDPDALREVCPDAYRLLAAWREDRGSLSAGRLVEEVVRDSAALFAFGNASGPAASLNIEKLTGIARDFDRRGGSGLSGFIEWVKAYRDKAELATADVELPGFERFVNIMTVHAAKGLEFPVVFLPGAARKPRTAVDGFIIGEDEGAFGMAIKTDALLKENPGYARLKEEEDRERAEEAIRLMYVAMTRARDHLIMLAGLKPDANGGPHPHKESWLGFLFSAKPGCLLGQGPGPGETPAVYRYPAEDPARLEPKPEGHYFSGLAIPGPTPLMEALMPLPEAPDISFASPHELTGGIHEDDDTGRPYPAKLRGILIHSLLESFGRYGKYDAASSADRTAGFAMLDKHAGKALIKDAERAVSSLLADGAIKALLSPGKDKYHELPLLLGRDGEVLAGTADLVIIEGDRARVIDYKTGLMKAPLDEIKAAYMPQLSAYCEAVKAAFALREAVPYLLLVDRIEILQLR